MLALLAINHLLVQLLGAKNFTEFGKKYAQSDKVYFRYVTNRTAT